MESAQQGLIAIGVFLVFVIIFDSVLILRMQRTLEATQRKLAQNKAAKTRA